MALPMPTFANCQKQCRFPFKARELGSPIRLRTGRVCFCWTECLAGNSGRLPTVVGCLGGAGEAAHFTGGVKKGTRGDPALHISQRSNSLRPRIRGLLF